MIASENASDGGHGTAERTSHDPHTADDDTVIGIRSRTPVDTSAESDDQPVPVYMAASGPLAAKLCGRIGEGFICTSGKGMELYTDKLLPAVAEALHALAEARDDGRQRPAKGDEAGGEDREDAREPRYRMLEMVREYGLGQLAASNELDDARREHAVHFLALAERLKCELRHIWLSNGRQESVGEAQSTGGGADPMDFPHDAHRALITDFLDAVAQGRSPRVSGRGWLKRFGSVTSRSASSGSAARARVRSSMSSVAVTSASSNDARSIARVSADRRGSSERNQRASATE